MTEWILLAGTLGGAIIGIAGTLGAQILANHAEADRSLASRDEARRAELKACIDQLIRATQLAEEAAAHHQDEAALKGHAASEMWIAYKALSLVGDGALRDTAASFCNELNACLWNPTSAEPWRRIADPQQRFLAAATEASRHPDPTEELRRLPG
ncbi:MAG: hypothetical protein ACRDNZ_02680 [Streptosporangiaceae bacterium]